MSKNKTTDQDVVDAIATLLGTSEDWDGADILEWIAEVVGKVRPHPGEPLSGFTYQEAFKASTGRDVPEDWDQTVE